MKKILLTLIALLLFGWSGAEAEVNSDEVFRAMQDELERSMKELKMDTLKRPYYIEYYVTINHQQQSKATLGNILSNVDMQRAMLDVVVRVGDYKFDQKNFLDFSLGFFGSSDEEEPYQNRTIPVELDYSTLRREFWLATDVAYKEAAELYARKEAALKNSIRKDTLWDFVKESGVQFVEPLKEPKYDSVVANNYVKILSKVFAEYSNIYNSVASYYLEGNTIYYLNSEGTRYIKNKTDAGIEVSAYTKADDGMPLYNFYVAIAEDVTELPSIDLAKGEVEKVAKMLLQQRNATSIDESYAGPILMSDQASTQAFAQCFALNFAAQRDPLQGSTARIGLGGAGDFRAFQNKIGGRVLPEAFTIEDLPTLATFSGVKLLGHTIFDDDAVVPKDLTLVKDGYLQTLLTTRTPVKRINYSNGRNSGGVPAFTNLKVSANKKFQKTDIELKKQLLKLVKQRDLPFGILVRKVADKNMLNTSIVDIVGVDRMSFYGMNKANVIYPVEMYKVYGDGREELVRGGVISLPSSSFKDIIACGNKENILNLFAPKVRNTSNIWSDSPWNISSVIAPNLLFEDLEVQVNDENYAKNPYLANPISEK